MQLLIAQYFQIFIKAPEVIHTQFHTIPKRQRYPRNVKSTNFALL